jgi:hypothetical protein
LETITCPICGRSGLKVLKLHFNRSHKDIDWYKFLDDHPEIETISDFTKDKMRIRNKNEWESEEFRIMKSENSKETMIRLNEDPEFKKANGERSKQRMLDKWSDPEFRRAMSENQKEYCSTEEAKIKLRAVNERIWSDPELSKRMSPKHNCKYGVVNKFTLPNGQVLNLRSLLERKVVSKLVMWNVEFEYNSIVIKWIRRDGTSHLYHPDIIVGNDILIEVKSPDWINDQDVLDKLEYSRKLGYKCFLIPCISDLYKIKDKLISVTTIES